MSEKTDNIMNVKCVSRLKSLDLAFRQISYDKISSTYDFYKGQGRCFVKGRCKSRFRVKCKNVMCKVDNYLRHVNCMCDLELYIRKILNMKIIIVLSGLDESQGCCFDRSEDIRLKSNHTFLNF